MRFRGMQYGAARADQEPGNRRQNSKETNVFRGKSAEESTNWEGAVSLYRVDTATRVWLSLAHHFRGSVRAGMSDVTRILSAIEQGDPQASEQLLPLVYEELRRLAAQKIAEEKPGQTLQATGLVHEAYLRLVDGEQVRRWDSRGHFFSAAAEAMRRILVDKARARRSLKRGGGRQRVALESSLAGDAGEAPRDDLLALDGVLAKFAAAEPVKAQVLKIHFFAGLTLPETAEVLGISLATAERYWAFARTWLFAALDGAKKDSARENL
jgi:RNA polymerase sigma factor (TIGR02999 family)